MRNDPRLGPLIESGGSDAEVERLLVEVAAPVVRGIVGRYFRGAGDSAGDAADLESAINLRLLVKLRRIATLASPGVEDLDSYIATVSYNVVNDHLRRRYPERTRLKNRVRYLLMRDPRLALWTAPAGLVAGLKEWSGSAAAVTAVPLDPADATRPMRDRGDPAGALHALLEAVGTPVSLEALIDHLAVLWQVDLGPREVDDQPAAEPHTEPLHLENRELLRALWREIEQLRPMQRKALLLNLRDDETVNVVSLVVLTGTAKFDAIAGALDMSPEQLADIWNDLPLDDLRIAALLNVTRQQVINLRRAARDRLRRRLGFRNIRSL
jgi:DNA-directed RNA polymerase specialized sigma24 family protein